MFTCNLVWATPGVTVLVRWVLGVKRMVGLNTRNGGRLTVTFGMAVTCIKRILSNRGGNNGTPTV